MEPKGDPGEQPACVLTVSTRALDTPWTRIAAIPGRFFATFLANSRMAGAPAAPRPREPTIEEPDPVRAAERDDERVLIVDVQDDRQRERRNVDRLSGDPGREPGARVKPCTGRATLGTSAFGLGRP